MSTSYLSDAELDAVTGGFLNFSLGSFDGNDSHNTTITITKNTAVVPQTVENVSVLPLASGSGQHGTNNATVVQTIL